MASDSGRASSSLLFDWTMAVLACLLMGGVLTDGWAHSHGIVDQTFVTPWHALLYGSMAVNGLVLLVAGILGLMRGHRFVDALPPGYWMSAIGVSLFVFGGGFDFWWHTKFGIESGIVLLITPPHLLLALSGAMVMSGPIQSIAVRYGREAAGWTIVGPAILSTWALITIVGFFLAYAQPIEDGFTPLTMRPSKNATIYPMLYIADARGNVSRIGLPARTDLETVDVSPDGKHIAYRVNRYQDPDSFPPSDIYVAGIDGSHPVRVTDSGRHDTQPAWSPDGKTIAYVSMPAETSGNFEIRLMKPDGSGQRTLLSQGTRISELSWSPDGKRIAFGSRRNVTEMLATIDVASGQWQWLPFTAGAMTPLWTVKGIVYSVDGAIVRSSLDGSKTETLATHSDGSPTGTHDGKHLAFLRPELGGDQLFVSDGDGKNAHDVSQFSGLDVQDGAWAPDGRVLFVVEGRPDMSRTFTGKSLAMAAILLQAILIAGGVLLLVRRWNVPFGGITLVLTAFTLAMAVQTDYYFYAVGALVVGLLADTAVALLGERVRAGFGFNAIGFLVPLLFTAAFEIITVQSAGGESAWVWNLLLGAPLLAGAAGLFMAFCFDSPFERLAPN